jgi:hypothetical protein
MSYTKTKIILLIWVVVFISTTSFLVYRYLELEKIKESTSVLEQDILKEKESLLAFDSLVKTVSNIKEDSEKINTYFIKRDEVVNFLDVIESLASTTKTQISIQSVSDKNSDPNSMLLSVVVHANGSYSNLHYLIRLFEELPYQTEIQNVRLLSQGTKDQGGSAWTLDVTIVGVMQ